jgi:hypothetical protein
MKSGLKGRVFERLAGSGGLAVCPACDHDKLAGELRQHHDASSAVLDISDLLEPAPEGSGLDLSAVAYVTTESASEPAPELVSRAIHILTELAALPQSVGISISPGEIRTLSAFLVVREEQRWLRSIVNGILAGRAVIVSRAPSSSGRPS